MSNNKAKSFNHQVYTKAYKRLHLSPVARTVFQRLLGFLLRNEKPFPYSAVKLSEITGYTTRTIFRSLQELEQCRLIERIGLGKNRKFKRGSMLIKILTTVTNRNLNVQCKNQTTATLCHQNLINRDIESYKKTSFSLKHNNKRAFTIVEQQQFHYYTNNPQFPIPAEWQYLFNF